MIVLENICKSYGSKSVLKNINLTFERGKVYGIVGENGAGKTTLFRCIAKIESFDGSIQTEIKPLKDQLGFLQTNPIFMSRITGWEYLKLLCVARNIQKDDFSEQNIFDLPLEEYADNYSTGMKKKLALMGTLLQQNEVFILDEPFNGVDIQSNMIISEIIHKLKQENKIVLIASHIFSTLSDTCDQIHLLKNGMIDKSVEKSEFDELNLSMKSFVVGNKLDKLNF